MEFIKNNLRGIIISLLVAGAIIGIASISNDDTDDVNDAETSQNGENSQDAENTNDKGDENSDGESNDDDSSTDKDGDSEETDSETKPDVSTSDDGFNSTTVSGDNQTVVVRRIVENFLNDSETELSAEQMLYVETNLVNDVGRNDLIAVGEEISLSNATVEQRVEEAKNLSDAAIDRWSKYL